MYAFYKAILHTQLEKSKRFITLDFALCETRETPRLMFDFMKRRVDVCFTK